MLHKKPLRIEEALNKLKEELKKEAI